MCTILFSWKQHSNYSLIVAANRDEFHSRPTEPAHFWTEYPDLLAGKDLTAGGTWMGIHRKGRFAALTNYRDIDRTNPHAPSRGKLTLDFLIGESSPKAYLNELIEKEIEYNPFNLLVADQDSLWYYSNISGQPQALAPGLYGLSNGLLNDPWPKVRHGKLELQKWVTNQQEDPKQLLSILQNKDLAPDDELPKTGVPYGMEKALSALHIDLDSYGTRCSTALLQNEQESVFVEKTYAIRGQKEQIVSHRIPILPR
ncbi:hypothetical protein BFP72_13790 [Reichenbachiella sp. 5M10]|uniref:NRDE family protein n=1 Tax=Reichenbachiella sp. 5M10 TaxID=1889772 RepID=UPI000C144AB3|nr:NRDE family protein [Reichenbachiella sp. 5M10]PIB36391.1 hypothetical protein BFP72_13790 [Reichenbachiella sp. 5M10]